jgi:hypothetical protein
MRNNLLIRKRRDRRSTALAFLACAAAFAALVACSSGSGDPSPQPSVSIADLLGHWEEDAGNYPFNVTIEAGKTPGTAAFIAPFDRCGGTVSLSGGTATLSAHAAAFYDDAHQTITVNPEFTLWKTVFEKYSGGNEPLEGFWVAEVNGNEHGLSIEFDGGSSTSGTFEYLVQGLSDPLYTGTFTCEYDGDNALIEIAFDYGEASLNASKDVLTLTRVFDPEEPVELLKNVPAIPTLADYEASWVYSDPGVSQHYVSIDGVGGINYTQYNGVGGIVYRKSGTLTVDAQGVGHATASMSLAFEYDAEEENVIATIPGVKGNIFDRGSGASGSVIGTWSLEVADEKYVYLSFAADGTMSYTDQKGLVMTGAYTYDSGEGGGSLTASGELAALTIDSTMNPRIIYFTPSGGSEILLAEQPV